MATIDQLTHKERQLELLLALDKARDAVDIHGDPHAMFHAILKIIKSYFTADACAVMTFIENPQEIETISHLGTDQAVAVGLCQQAIELTIPARLQTDEWAHTLGMAIIQEANKRILGGLFLARMNTPFTDDDIQLLKIAESQIDSAVIQARMIWDLVQHNLQLESIYQIDRLRDSTSNEGDLIGGFTSILVDHFKAEVCLVFLSHVDSGEMILRGMVDKQNLPSSALDTIRELTGYLTIPQAVQTTPEIGELSLLAAPLISSGERLGSVVVGRQAAFTTAEHRLLFAMMSQMDSAIAHSRISQQLHQRNEELETIYRIDKIRDSEKDFDTMLQKVLTELCKAVSSEMGYMMLYKPNGEELQLQATTDNLFASPMYQQAIRRISKEAIKGEGEGQAKTIFSNKPDGAVRSIVAVPLILNDRVLGVFGTVNSSNPRGFSREDRRMLEAIASQVDTAVFEGLERRRLRKVMGRSVDPKVLNRMLEHTDDTLLAGERKILTIIFADLRGSTEWAEHTEPEELVSTLNAFLGKMTDVIFEYGGTLDKFVGDEVIALFGSPIPMPDHARQAARCAMHMQATHHQLQLEMAEKGIKLPSMGIGISSGEVIAGEFGPPIRTDYTAMGRAMNLGARLCGVAVAGQIIISRTTYDMLDDAAHVQKMKSASVKGIGEVEVYELLSI